MSSNVHSQELAEMLARPLYGFSVCAASPVDALTKYLLARGALATSARLTGAARSRSGAKIARVLAVPLDDASLMLSARRLGLRDGDAHSFVGDVVPAVRCLVRATSRFAARVVLDGDRDSRSLWNRIIAPLAFKRWLRALPVAGPLHNLANVDDALLGRSNEPRGIDAIVEALFGGYHFDPLEPYELRSPFVGRLFARWLATSAPRSCTYAEHVERFASAFDDGTVHGLVIANVRGASSSWIQKVLPSARFFTRHVWPAARSAGCSQGDASAAFEHVLVLIRSGVDASVAIASATVRAASIAPVLLARQRALHAIAWREAPWREHGSVGVISTF
jgi:hypothetical protein